MTRRACADDAANQQEIVVIQAFDATRGSARDGDRMSLLDESGAVLLTYAGGSTDLPDTQWQVTGVNTGSAIESTTLTEQLSLAFGASDQVSGNGGCNSFSGTYTVDGDQLTFGPLASTEMACADDVMALEQSYFAALEKVTSFRRTGTTLDLLDASGATQVTLIPPSP
jgi:heat shock protein HslJ